MTDLLVYGLSVALPVLFVLGALRSRARKAKRLADRRARSAAEFAAMRGSER